MENPGGALTGMRALENFRGMSITIPHKIESMNHVDEIPDIDRKIGCINTVIHEDGRLIGFGTDGPGAIKALEDAGVGLQGKSVLMLGAGGAARAIAFTLAGTGIDTLKLLDIDENFLRPLAADLREGAPAPVEDLRERVIRGTIAARTPLPRPYTVPYKDCLFAVHLTEVRAAAGEPLADEVIGYLWGMRDNVWTEAAGYRVGQQITLRVRPWEEPEVQKRYGTYNRKELDDPELLMLPAFWAEPRD